MEGFTLENMFAMDFAKFHDIVQGIIVNAVQESQIEQRLNKIIDYWRVKQFSIVEYIKGDNESALIFESLDELLNIIEDHMLNLQNIAASQYVSPFHELVQIWEKILQTISDVIEAWTELQQKWLYLEGIFSNQDVKIEQPNIAKNFENVDKEFIQIMIETSANINVYECCMVPGRQERLKILIDNLNKCEKSLTNYLDSVRITCPRFYFLSDNELLGILGARNLELIQIYIAKIFENLQELEISSIDENGIDAKFLVTGLVSCEGEKMSFKHPVTVTPNIVMWVFEVLEQMKGTHQYLTKKAVYDYGKAQKKRCEWFFDFQGMVLLAADKIWWTAEVENVFDQLQKGSRDAMKEYLQYLNSLIADTMKLIKSNNLINQDRKKLESIVTTDIHSRDIVAKFVKDGITNDQQFEWESQLRFYWVHDLDNLWINSGLGCFEYGYEYMGLNERLVASSLTDRLHLTITQTLSLHMGVALSGPAASGKTETVKNLAKVLGRLCMIINCSAELNCTVINKIIIGLMQCGAWGCFDEFNRIGESIISIISTQLHELYSALSAKSKTVTFGKESITLDHKTALFLTLNPDESHRNKIPESVKSLFRPASCVSPDSELICEVKLFSFGFNMPKILAKKLTTFYKFINELLSRQLHYDFSLRSLISVLNMAQKLKRSNHELSDSIISMLAIKEICFPALISDDVSLFNGLLKDIFPGLDETMISNEDFQKTVEEALKKDGYMVLPDQVEKIIQLRKMMMTRNSTMIVGETGAGKTTILKNLCKAQAILNNSTKVHVLNPKACTVSELYGNFDSSDRKWTDGILSKIFREINKPLEASQLNEKRCIVFDGDADSHWMENINSVLDDNRILTLANHERIKLQNYCHLLFEVGNLCYASPTTVCRVGLIYVDPKNIGYEPYLNKWINGKNKEEQGIFRNLCNKYIPGVLKLIIDGVLGLQQVVPLKMIIHQTALNMIKQFCDLVDSLLSHCEMNNILSSIESRDNSTDIKKITDDLIDDKSAFIQALIIQSCYYSLGSVLTLECRPVFDEYMKKTSGLILIEDTDEKFATIKQLPIRYPLMYDYVLDVETKVWKPWKSMVPEYIYNRDSHFCDIFVPTDDTVRSFWFIKLMNKYEKPCLLVGESGSSKTAVVCNYLKTLDPEKYIQLLINFSAITKSFNVQRTIESILEKRTRDLYGPVPGKRLIIFIDDLGLPLPDLYGTQQPIAFLKHLFEYRGFYDQCKDLNWKQIRDVGYLTAMRCPEQRNDTMDPRFISLFSIFNVDTPSNSNLKYIYSRILTGHVSIFLQEIQQITDYLVEMTVDLYEMVKKTLLPTPSKFHYIFNIRDISKIFEGILQTTPDFFGTSRQFLRSWRNEAVRVICDRLIDDEDQMVVHNYIDSKIKEIWYNDRKTIEYSLRDPLLFGDFRNACNEKNDRFYEDVLDYDAVYNLFMEILEKYNEKNSKLNIVLFNDVLDHLTHIHRALRLHNGHVLVIGHEKCGKQSTIKLASFAANFEVFQISLYRKYNANNFQEDLLQLYHLIAVENKKVTLLFNHRQIVEESFLEMINSILVTGVLPTLFFDDKLKAIVKLCRGCVTNEGHNVTKENIFIYLRQKCMENLRIVLSMNPTDKSFKYYCQNYPGIIKCTTIDWMFPWPQEAFLTVANFFLRDNIDIPEEHKKSIVEYIVDTHMSIEIFTSKLFTETRLQNYVTPSHFFDFINTYTKLLTGKKNSLDLYVDKLKKGLKKILDASETVVHLSEDIIVQRNKVITQTELCEKLLISIDEKTQVVNEKRKLNEERQQEIESRKQLIVEESAAAKTSLDSIKPNLENTRKALNQLQKSDIIELRSLLTPPEPIQITGECIVILRGLKDVSWKTAKGLMSDPSFLKCLQDIKAEDVSAKQEQKIRSQLKKYDKFDELESMTFAGYRLYKFVLAILDYCSVYREMKPKLKLVTELEVEVKKAQSELEKEEREFELINQQLSQLNSKYEETIHDETKLQKETDSLEKRLAAAKSLINNFSSENARWQKQLIDVQDKLIFVIGNCLLSASFIAYCGPFPHEFRTDMIYNKWKINLIQKNIPLSESFRIEHELSDDAQIRQFNTEGLLSDEFSIQNGILTTHASSFPFFVDPQQLAFHWIKQREYDNNLKIVTFYDNDFIDQLELAMKYGYPIIFQDVDFIDPIIDNVLKKDIHHDPAGPYIILNNRKVDYNPKFKLYFMTIHRNPNLDSSIYFATTLIHNMITPIGLQNKLLSVMMETECPDVEEQRNNLMSKSDTYKNHVDELRHELLQKISINQENMLDNIDTIETLDNLNIEICEIEKKLLETDIFIKELNKLREKYSPITKRSAILFFVLTDMAMINPMYQYGLRNYLEIFKNILKSSSPSPTIEKRIKNIIKTLTQKIYEYGCIGIFEADKLLYSFQICLRIEQSVDNINREEIDFFINPQRVIEKEAKNTEISPIDWLHVSKWNEILSLSSNFEAFSTLHDDIVNHPDDWLQWFETENPEVNHFPCGYSEKLKPFQRLVLIRCFRIDRLYCAIVHFISSLMGKSFLISENINYETLIEKITPFSPILFMLRPGADPTSKIMQFAKGFGFKTEEIKRFSLGQYQEQTATNLIKLCTTNGQWLILENCHLLLEFVRKIDKIVMFDMTPHPDFRLWLTSEPADNFPVGVLQQSLKVAAELPNGLKLKLEDSYSNIENHILESCDHPKYKDLIYVLAFFHAVVQERKKYPHVQWDINYNFNDNDFNMSVIVLGKYLGKLSNIHDCPIPFDCLKYLISQIIYGGRVTDYYDNRILRTYADEYFGDFLFDEYQPFHFYADENVEYVIPPVGNQSDYLNSIKNLPQMNSPEVLGLHSNVEMNYFSQAIQIMSLNLSKIEPQTCNIEKHTNRDEIINSRIEYILTKIPKKYEMSKIKRTFSLDMSPLATFLFQEIERFNQLIQTIDSTLNRLKKAILGEITLNASLENISDSLYNNELPREWRNFAPVTEKNLADWMDHFCKRTIQYNEWASGNEPVVFWLSGFYAPRTFLAAFIQIVSRRNNWELDKTSIKTEVSKFQQAAEIEERLDQSCYINGLYIEGAKWDINECCLKKSSPRVSIEEFPILLISPIESHCLEFHNYIHLPTYVTPNKDGGVVFETDLRTKKHASFWILGGVCLLLNLK